MSGVFGCSALDDMITGTFVQCWENRREGMYYEITDFPGLIMRGRKWVDGSVWLYPVAGSAALWSIVGSFADGVSTIPAGAAENSLFSPSIVIPPSLIAPGMTLEIFASLSQSSSGVSANVSLIATYGADGTASDTKWALSVANITATSSGSESSAGISRVGAGLTCNNRKNSNGSARSDVTLPLDSPSIIRLGIAQPPGTIGVKLTAATLRLSGMPG